jgi:hypothetical protein
MLATTIAACRNVIDLLVEKVSPPAFSKPFWNFICALLPSSIADEIKLQVKTNPN